MLKGVTLVVGCTRFRTGKGIESMKYRGGTENELTTHLRPSYGRHFNVLLDGSLEPEIKSSASALV